MSNAFLAPGVINPDVFGKNSEAVTEAICELNGGLIQVAPSIGMKKKTPEKKIERDITREAVEYALGGGAIE